MTMKLRFTLLFLLSAIAVHTYLTLHYYPLNFGYGAGQAMCNLSETLNCDAASASQFASFLGIPIAVWGAITNLILLVFVIGYGLRWSDDTARLMRYSFYLSGLIALASVVMGALSVLFLGAYCIFCIAAYVLSFATFELLRRQQEGPVFKHLKADIAALFGPARSILITIVVGIPVLSYLVHAAMLQRYDASSIQRAANTAISDWLMSPLVKFEVPPSLSKGADKDKAVMTIVEFADFRCGHCKIAADSLNAFVKSHPDVRLEFYNYPLDGACNPSVPRAVGISCRLAKAVHCGEEQNAGWAVHAGVFAAQEDFHHTGTTDEVDEKIPKLIPKVALDWEKLKSCMDSDNTHKAISNQAKIGELAQVQGTPTIYVNGRKLPGGQMLPILEKVRNEIVKRSGP